MPEPEHLVVRQRKSNLLLDSLHAWMVEKNATLVQKSRLGEWFSCVPNQWGALCYYGVDGQAEADIMPRKKPFVPSVLNKNFMFFDGERSDCCMGLSAPAF